MAKKQRSRTKTTHRKPKATKSRRVKVTISKKRGKFPKPMSKNVASYWNMEVPKKTKSRRKTTQSKKKGLLGTKFKLADFGPAVPQLKGLTLETLYTLVSAGLEKLTDRYGDIEERLERLEAGPREIYAETPYARPHTTVSVVTVGGGGGGVTVPGVTIDGGQLEVDTDETWKWTEGHMLAFVKMAKDMEPPDLDLHAGRPRKMRKVLFDWMRDQGLEPSDLPPKGESFPEDLAPAVGSTVTPDQIMGITASRHGMTAPQGKALRALIEKFKPREFHHGDCVGGDEDGHEIYDNWRRSTSALTLDEAHVIHVHPPDDDKLRARVKLREGDVLHEEKPYHARNHDIVNVSTIMVGLPYTAEEEVKSGTWATIRYAKKHGMKPYVIRPDGSVTRK